MKVSRVRAALLLGAVAATVVLLITVIESLSTPWALSLTGAPTLTGEWVGTVKTKSGRTLDVWLSIHHPLHSDKCMNCPQIEGEARTCEARRDERRYHLWGNVEDWRGSAFLLKTLEESERPLHLTLGYMNGRWSGDVLDLTTTFRLPRGDPDTQEPVHWRMQRGSESDFRRSCR